MEPAVDANGWERRFMADPARAEEAVRLYRELGYEVRVEPIQADPAGVQCETCRLAEFLRLTTIYTRRRRT